MRLADKVLTEKIGTCLDTLLLFASCLEAVGINPILVIVSGHAFVGAWLMDWFCWQEVCDDGSYLVKQSADGIHNLVLVETTCLTKSGSVTFDDAVDIAERNVRNDWSFIHFVDVHRCRLADCRLLPQRIMNGAEWTVENEGVKHKQATKEIRMPNHYALHLDDNGTEITKQAIWERKLLDFSLRNNLVNCRMGRRVIPFVSFNVDALEDNLNDGVDYTVVRFLDRKIEPMLGGMYDSRLQADNLRKMVGEEIKNSHRSISSDARKPVMSSGRVTRSA